MRMQGELASRRKGLRNLTILLVSVGLAIANATAIRASGMLDQQEDSGILRDEIPRRHLLKQSSCTLYRKFVENEPGVNLKDESWACKLTDEDGEMLDADFLDIDESSPLISVALENATSGESTLIMDEAIVDTEHMQLIVSEETRIDVKNEPKIVLGGNRVAPSKTGTHKLLVIRITDGNRLAPAVSTDEIYKNLFEDDVCLQSQMKACSYGKLQIEPFMGETPSQFTVDNGIVNITVPGIASHDAKFVRAARKAARQKLGNLDDPRFGLVMFCLPKGVNGIAWAYAKNKHSFYTDKWCGNVPVTMHEVGHNIGLAHSGEPRQGDAGDGVGYMGSNPGKRDVRMCYNPQKSFQLGWYADKTKTIHPLDGKGTHSFTLNGIADYRKKNNALVVLRLEQIYKRKDYYIGFNVAKGINRDTREDKGKIVIVRKEKGGPTDYGKSMKVASLVPGQRHVIRNFDRERNIQVVFKSLKNGNAKIDIIDNDELPPTPVFIMADGNCKNFTVELKTDTKPKEISWYIIDKHGNAVATSKNYGRRRKKYFEEVCLPMLEEPHTYKFVILDDKSNGICCGRGNGYYAVIDDEGKTIASGAKFSFSRRHAIRVPKDPSLAKSSQPTPTLAPTISPAPSSSSPPSLNPTELCVNNPSFKLNGKNGRNCKWVARKRTLNRCKKRGVMANCRATCDPRCRTTNAPSVEPTLAAHSDDTSSFPSNAPSFRPTTIHSGHPSSSNAPSFGPTMSHSDTPSSFPSNAPSFGPTFADHSGDPSSSSAPSFGPTLAHSGDPSSVPSNEPSFEPTLVHSVIPSYTPSGLPSEVPSSDEASSSSDEQSSSSDEQSSIAPSENPSEQPSFIDSSGMPSAVPSSDQAIDASERPSSMPSSLPSLDQTTTLSQSPSAILSSSPSMAPTVLLSERPSGLPSSVPSSDIPSQVPSRYLDADTSETPSDLPSSVSPSGMPSAVPSLDIASSEGPFDVPSLAPSNLPSLELPLDLSQRPSDFPSSLPSNVVASNVPSHGPTSNSSERPSDFPSSTPTLVPPLDVSNNLSRSPSAIPSWNPSRGAPSALPSSLDSSGNPSGRPSGVPSFLPSGAPSQVLADVPSQSPSEIPSVAPLSNVPSTSPSSEVTFLPATSVGINVSAMPSNVPSDAPSETGGNGVAVMASLYDDNSARSSRKRDHGGDPFYNSVAAGGDNPSTTTIRQGRRQEPDS